MTMQTPRLTLPLIEPGQAQKELVHNEALAIVDIAVQAVVAGAARNDPPVAPVEGQCWIVGIAPTGEWAGRADAIAGWTAGGWRFVAAREGLSAWDESARVGVRYTDGAWHRGTTVVDPSGGTIIDTEARATLRSLIAALRSQGLVAG